MNTHPIETPRPVLRPFRQSDLAGLYEYLSQKEQQRLAGNCPCDSTDDAKLCPEYNMSTEFRPCTAGNRRKLHEILPE